MFVVQYVIKLIYFLTRFRVEIFKISFDNKNELKFILFFFFQK